jgi:hypothetical protein
MATVEQVGNAMHAAPFRPFRVRLVDGRSYLVRHPDFVALPTAPRRRDITVHDDDGPHWIDLGLVSELYLEASPSAAEPGAEGNGA